MSRRVRGVGTDSTKAALSLKELGVEIVGDVVLTFDFVAVTAALTFTSWLTVIASYVELAYWLLYAAGAALFHALGTRRPGRGFRPLPGQKSK